MNWGQEWGHTCLCHERMRGRDTHIAGCVVQTVVTAYLGADLVLSGIVVDIIKGSSFVLAA